MTGRTAAKLARVEGELADQREWSRLLQNEVRRQVIRAEKAEYALHLSCLVTDQLRQELAAITTTACSCACHVPPSDGEAVQ